jgi:hypothetical protein
MKLPVNQRIGLAQKMLRGLDSTIVEDTVLQMRFLPDGAAAVSASLEKALHSKRTKAALDMHQAALTKARDTRRALLKVGGFTVRIGLSKSFDDIAEKDLATLDRWIKERQPGKPSRFDPSARVAVQTALKLLRLARRPTKKTRGSDWCKLAAILYGEPDKNMHYYVREFRRPNPASK